MEIGIIALMFVSFLSGIKVGFMIKPKHGTKKMGKYVDNDVNIYYE